MQQGTNKKEYITLFLVRTWALDMRQYSPKLICPRLMSPKPLWIDSLDQLAPPWCAMEWSGRDFCPECKTVSGNEGTQ